MIIQITNFLLCVRSIILKKNCNHHYNDESSYKFSLVCNRSIWKFEWLPTTCLGTQAEFVCPQKGSMKKIEGVTPHWNANLCAAASLMTIVSLHLEAYPRESSTCPNNTQRRAGFKLIQCWMRSLLLGIHTAYIEEKEEKKSI